MKPTLHCQGCGLDSGQHQFRALSAGWMGFGYDHANKRSANWCPTCVENGTMRRESRSKNDRRAALDGQGDAAALPEQEKEQDAAGLLGSTVPSNPLEGAPHRRDERLLRDTVSMLCHFVWNRQLRAGEHLWSIPVDKERDFDCILGDAITELVELRRRDAEAQIGGATAPCTTKADKETTDACVGKAAGDAAPRVAPSNWQAIETAQSDEGTYVLLYVPGQPARHDGMIGTGYNDGEGWHDWNGHAYAAFAGEPTHWMPLPSPPATSGSGDEARADKEKDDTGLPR